jgi:starch-binding outer membrane protein, SusD/RagB family
MRFTTRKYRPTLLLIAALAVTGCEDFLSKVPDNRTTLDTKEKIAELLVTAYPEGNYIPFCEAMSDNVEDNPSTQQDVRNTDAYFWRDVTSTAQDSPENYWNSCYTAIAAANHALRAIDESDDPSFFNSEKGEALVARAYAHFMLVSMFSKIYNPITASTDPGIPYVTDPETESLKTYARGTVQSVYEQIEKDLLEGLPLIDDRAYETDDADATGVPSYHFTTAAAHAFATRFYLCRQSYDKVVEHASKVFSNGDFGSNLRQWNTTYRSYSRNDLINTYTRSTEKTNLLICETLSDWSVTYNSQKYTTGIGRLEEMFYPNVTGGTFAYSVYYGSSQVYYVPKFREHFVKTGTNATTGFSYTVVPLFTAEEVLLNKAEAHTMRHELTQALDDLNVLVSKRVVDYVPEYHNLSANKLYNFYGENINQKATLRAVMDLRRAEFLHEGLRWFDILRHKMEVVHPVRDAEPVVLGPYDQRRVLQIPAEAISMGGLEPNPR